MNVLEYAKGVEKLVNPMAVGKTHYMQTKLAKLPVCLQKKIVTSATKKAGMMPFVVEPYCTFLFYEIEDPTKIEKYLPAGFRPAKASIFEDKTKTESGSSSKQSATRADSSKTKVSLSQTRTHQSNTGHYYGIVSMFRIHTSVFWGARAEYYLVAENTKTGLLSWVMMDYLSDTISYDERKGLKSPDVSQAVMTTTCEGDFVCDMRSLDKNRQVECVVSLLNGKMRRLNRRLWIEGNTSIAYGRLAGESDGDLFSLTFFPEEMGWAMDLPLSDVKNYRAYTKKTADIKAKLGAVVSFPFAQHMLSDAPGVHTHYNSEIELREAAEKIQFAKIKRLGE